LRLLTWKNNAKAKTKQQSIARKCGMLCLLRTKWKQSLGKLLNGSNKEYDYEERIA